MIYKLYITSNDNCTLSQYKTDISLRKDLIFNFHLASLPEILKCCAVTEITFLKDLNEINYLTKSCMKTSWPYVMCMYLIEIEAIVNINMQYVSYRRKKIVLNIKGVFVLIWFHFGIFFSF